MRLSNAQAVARPVYYDRNPVQATKNAFTQNAAPHAPTVRASYTVPAGKKGFLDTLDLVIHRTAVAAPVGLTECYCRYTPSGGAAVNLQYIALLTNGAGDFRSKNGSQLGTMFAGDLLEFLDNDASTGGTVTYLETGKITEFDA